MWARLRSSPTLPSSPEACGAAAPNGYGWIHEMATGKIQRPRTDVSGKCTAAVARKSMPCATAIARIDCWVNSAAGCIAGLAVAYQNPNQGNTTLCDTGAGAPAASLSLASGEVVLKLVPRAARARLRPSFRGGGSTCITRLAATTSAGRTWSCDARPPPPRGGRGGAAGDIGARSAEPGTAGLAPGTTPAGPVSALQRSRAPPPEPSFLCNLPLASPSCHFFRWGLQQETWVRVPRASFV